MMDIKNQESGRITHDTILMSAIAKN